MKSLHNTSSLEDCSVTELKIGLQEMTTKLAWANECIESLKLENSNLQTKLHKYKTDLNTYKQMADEQKIYNSPLLKRKKLNTCFEQKRNCFEDSANDASDKTKKTNTCNDSIIIDRERQQPNPLSTMQESISFDCHRKSDSMGYNQGIQKTKLSICKDIKKKNVNLR